MLQTISLRAALLIAVCFFTACLKEKEDVGTPAPPAGINGPVYDWTKIADSAQSSLTYFWSASGKVYLTSNSSTDWGQYWPNAHALDVLIDAYVRNPSPAVKARMDELVNGVKAKNGNTWINYYYDDMEWMALACLRAYQATNDAQYKTITDLLWADIKAGWSNDLNGGLWWRKDYSSKNTPSNMPAAILAARLYKAFNNADDLAWANKIYDWQKATLYEAATGWVYDNIDKNGNKNTTWKFTYNQGTFIGAALELYKITNNLSYQSDAIKATEFAVSSGQLTANGILKDEGGGDGGLFKGVFIRYFTRLIIDGNLPTDKKNNYLQFLKKNAESLWSKGTNKSLTLFGNAWDKAPGNTTDLTTQLSGAMLLEAMAELKKLDLLPK
ncbi:glycoside hydrolase family 76 protein [Paraflavitalea sp. CAU 1676]|uniref:glycoside hydrolase family 76 protein n=1 Tax=Paraflavitalea sp. CAU 1676 TaxID=3032598 RepID=UPI0023DC0006|nr:glycoside hydrolase family 76 protein [Paraflavitalea sp. CAU 1676]MDF2188374.1 glycoside hydrolase family 76 protein [Paraflavitalea sp. CAU 1676]